MVGTESNWHLGAAHSVPTFATLPVDRPVLVSLDTSPHQQIKDFKASFGSHPYSGSPVNQGGFPEGTGTKCEVPAADKTQSLWCGQEMIQHEQGEAQGDDSMAQK